MRSRLVPWTGVAALCWLAACGGVSPTVVVELESPSGLTSLRVAAKRYLDDGTVEVYEPIDLSSSEERTKARVLVELPAKGRWALHFVDADDLWGNYTATVCYAVAGQVVDHLALGPVPAEIDRDGDTFPEDVDEYCEARRSAGLECDTTCDGPAWSALGDCNPARGDPPDPGCGELPPDAAWNPFVGDTCGDCNDQDCYGGDAPCGTTDADGDGYVAGLDCDDGDPAVHPGADEVCGNGVDDNCRVDIERCADGDVPCDADEDGFLALVSEGCGSDCDDRDARISPAAEELCDTIDNDCDGTADEGCFPDDIDQDGYGGDEDCDDCNAGIHPGAPERCGDGVDQSCSGSDTPCAPGDEDGDGAPAPPVGSDCDDMDPRAYPGAPEHCGDGIAQGCAADSRCTSIVDLDADGFAAEDDCDDEDPSRSPWADEVCDAAGVDESCDGVVNEVVDLTGHRGCGFDPTAGEWYSVDHLTDVRHCGRCRYDCAASRAGLTCAGGECQCEGAGSCPGGLTAACCPSDGSRPARCADLTTDPDDCGICGTACRPGESCIPPSDGATGRCICESEGEACPAGDCWMCCPGVGCVDVCTSETHCGSCDLDCTEMPRPLGDRCIDGECRCGAAAAVCSGTTFCTEVTEPAGSTCGCRDLLGDVLNCGSCGTRCSDRDSCTEDSCVGGDCEYHTLDGDDDGYCASGCPDGHSGSPGDCSNGDCNDSDPDIHPGAVETCSTPTDDDCDGSSNDPDATGCSTYYLDSDRDGFGVASDSRCLCVAAAPYDATEVGDCDDTRSSTNPLATEVCNGRDDDCNAMTFDEASCPGLCCGLPVACRECCDAADCLAGFTCGPAFTCIPM